ncbi:MAG: hypothetical protein EAZ92_15770 [Candidatus Kapaibacterium sp.]|nr:MAG: hypothetical protein EAZ92_15770 [Candidatus Kapabacteria bacterium]
MRFPRPLPLPCTASFAIAVVVFFCTTLIPTELAAQVGTQLGTQRVTQQRLRALREFVTEFREESSAKSSEQEHSSKLLSPQERLRYEIERTIDPASNELPSNIKARELEFAATLPDNIPFVSPFSSSQSPRGQKSPTSSAQSLVWQNLGPGNVGGRVRAFAFDTRNEAIMLAGGVSGGMWRSLDTGASWVRVSAPNQIANVSCLAQDTRTGKENVWYYGTGELLSTTDRRVTTQLRTIHTGNGIFRSTDNGASWKPLQSTLLGGRTSNAGKPSNVPLSEMFQGVWAIAPDAARRDSDVVYAACYGGIMRSNDGGSAWQLVLGDTALKAWCSDIVIHPSGVMYAALSSAENGTPSPKQGVWRSSDGMTWTRIGTISQLAQIRRIRLAVAPSDTNALYVFAEAPTVWANRFRAFASRNTFFRYTHPQSGVHTGFSGWEDRSAFLPRSLSTLAGYAAAFAVHPTNPATVLFGGTDLYVSNDGGSTPQGRTTTSWRQIGGYPYTQDTNDLHPDSHHIVFSKNVRERVYVASDGGLASTELSGLRNSFGLLTWKQRSEGLVVAQIYYAALDRLQRGSNTVIGGLQDNSCFFTRSNNPRQGWTWAFGGDGMSCAVLPNNRGFLASSQYGYLYHVPTNARGDADFNPWWTSPDSLNGEPLYSSFCTLFVEEPTTMKELYMAMQNRLIRYNDLSKIPQDSISASADDRWVELRSVRNLLVNQGISALGISTTAPQHRLFAGTGTGRILRIDRANEETQTARDVSSTAFPRGGFVSSVSVDSRNGNRVLAAFSNYNIQSLFFSSDGGDSWQAVGGNLEENADGTGAGPSVRCVKIVNANGTTRYFAGTSVGLFSTDSLQGAQTQWRREGATTLGNVMVEDIDARESDGRMIAATHGNGVYAASIGVSEPSITAFSASELYPNPAKGAVALRLELPVRQRIRITLYNAIGQEITTLFNEILDEGAQILDFDTKNVLFRSLAGGRYFCRIQAGERIVMKQLMLVRE